MAKYALLRERLTRLLPAVQLEGAPEATPGQLALVHAPEYVEAIQSGTVSPVILKEIGFPWSPAMALRARLSVGATIAAVRAARAEGLAANLAGGTHHAGAASGAGFCVFNDVAVAARLAQAEHARESRRPLQVAIIDLDVHQGDGTARIFAQDESIFTLSLHGARNYPFRKARGSLDCELPDGCGDAHYLQHLDAALDEMACRFDPDLVIYLAGADPHEGDRLGRLSITDEGMEARDRRVFDWAWQRRLPLAFVMAGGYGHRLETTLKVQQTTFAVALEYWNRWTAVRQARPAMLSTQQAGRMRGHE